MGNIGIRVRESPFRTGVEFHKGLDISTRFGKEVVAPADGLVIEVHMIRKMVIL